MKTSSAFLLAGIGALMLFGPAFRSSAQNNPANQPLTPEEKTVQDREKWSQVLSAARKNFLNSNDRESSDFTGKIIESLNERDGMTADAIAADRERLNGRVRNLVSSGAMETAAAFQSILYDAFTIPPDSKATGPLHPNKNIGGTPGPGGLVLYFSFDKPDENGVIHDESGAGNNGVVFGAKWIPDGKFGGAYQFSITNLSDRIVVPNSDTLNPDYVTVAVWVKAADKDGFWNRILDKDYRNGYCLDLGGDYKGKSYRGKLQWETSVGSMGSDQVLDDGQWHHVAATYDGKSIHCFIDGVEKSRQVKNPGPMKKSGWDLCIGNSVVDYASGEFLAFDGVIDEVRIYNRALSGDEIKALVHATGPGADVLPAPDTSAGKPDPAERLKKVKALYDQGLINKDDYDKKVKEIMDSL